MMKIIVKPSEEVTAGSLDYGDTFQSVSGGIFMVVDGTKYVKEDIGLYNVILVDLEKGIIDSINKEAVVRPIKLIAREE